MLGYKKHIKHVRAGDSPTIKIDSVGLAGAAVGNLLTIGAI